MSRNKKILLIIFSGIFFVLTFSCDLFKKLSYDEWLDRRGILLPVFTLSGDYNIPESGNAYITIIGGGGGGASGDGVNFYGQGGKPGEVVFIERRVAQGDFFSVYIGNGGPGGILDTGAGGFAMGMIGDSSFFMFGGDTTYAKGGDGGMVTGGEKEGGDNGSGFGRGGDGGEIYGNGFDGMNGAVIIRIVKDH